MCDRSSSGCRGLLCLLALVVSPATAMAGETLDDLLVAYQEWGLPMPPADAVLVRFDRGERKHRDGRREPVRYLAFLARDARGEGEHDIYVGTLTWRTSHLFEKCVPVGPDEVDASKLTCWWWDATFPTNCGVATAVQCHARGWTRLASALLAQSIKHDLMGTYWWERAGVSPGDAGVRPGLALASTALAHWRHEISRPGSDWAVVAPRLRALAADDVGLEGEWVRSLAESVEAALVPSGAQPGSVEALIDDLMDLDMRISELTGRDPAPPYEKILLRGFDAVPALIEHLDDRRMTRCLWMGFNNFPTWQPRVEHIVSKLLKDISCRDLEKNWLRSQQGYVVSKESARKWWGWAQKKGEEAYCAARVIPRDERDEWPRRGAAKILGAKYPRRLVEAYRRLLDERPRMQSWPIADAFKASVTAKAEIIEVLSYACTHERLEHRRAAMWVLKDFDHELFVDHLVKTINGFARLPAPDRDEFLEKHLAEISDKMKDKVKNLPTAEGLSQKEPAFATLVACTEDDRAWQALAAAARRAETQFRMNLIRNTMYADCRRDIGPGPRRKRLEFYRSFLDDLSRRPAAKTMFQAGSNYGAISVRDYVCVNVASVLRIRDYPEDGWTEEDWQQYRDRTRKRLAEALGE